METFLATEAFKTSLFDLFNSCGSQFLFNVSSNESECECGAERISKLTSIDKVSFNAENEIAQDSREVSLLFSATALGVRDVFYWGLDLFEYPVPIPPRIDWNWTLDFDERFFVITGKASFSLCRVSRRYFDFPLYIPTLIDDLSILSIDSHSPEDQSEIEEAEQGAAANP